MNYEQLEARELAQQKLDEVDAVLAQRAAERTGQAKQWQPPPETPKSVQRAVAPPERPAPRAAVDWDKTRTWVLALIDGRVGTKTNKMVIESLEAVGGKVAELLAKHRDQLVAQAARITTLEATVTELRAEIGAERAARAAEAKYAALEARLAEAEQRAAATPAGPRLVGGADAA